METAEQIRLKIETLIKEQNPDADLAPGSVLSELITKLSATAQYSVRNEIATISQAASVKAALDSTEDTYNEVIDGLASNYDTYRNEGTRATGSIKVYVSDQKNYFLPSNLVFQQPNLLFNYVTTTEYTVSTDPGDLDLELKAEGSTYYFIVPVEAESVGVDSNVSTGTKFVLENTTQIPEFVDAEAYGTFTSGESKETDKELISRFKIGLATRNLISPYAIVATLKERFTGFKAASVVGIGDPELKRASNNIFGMTLPGKADVYVRTSSVVQTKVITVEGSLIVGGTYDGKWKIDLDSSVVPGMYRVLSIIQTKGDLLGTQNFISVTYGQETDVNDKLNDFTDDADARFTKYQTCSVIFEYPSVESTDTFDVTIAYQPYIDEIQSLFLDSDIRIPCADYLVKAVVPCSVSVYVKLVKKPGADDIPVSSIKQDIYTYINSLEMGEDIDVSRIIDICHNYNIRRVDLPVTLRGTILVPYSTTDETVLITGTDTLEIPYLPEKGITKATTAFFTNYYDDGTESIGIEVS